MSDLSYSAMKITPAMAEMAVGLEDVQWKAGKGKWSSNTQYQTISQCDKKAIEQFTQDQIDRGIVSDMAPGKRDSFPSLFL